MQHQIDAPLCRTAIDGRGERRINRCRHSVFPCHHRDLFQVHHPHRRIRRRLHIQQFRIRTNRPLMLPDVIRIDERRLNSKLQQPLRQKLERAAINIALRDDMISRFHKRQNRSRNRRHARRKQQRVIHAFEFRNRSLRRRIRRISISRIKTIGRRGAHLLRHVRNFKRRCLINRSRQRPVFLVEARAAAHRRSFPPQLSFFHFAVSCTHCRISASLSV